MRVLGFPRRSVELKIQRKILLKVRGLGKVEYVFAKEIDKMDYRGVKNKTEIVLGVSEVQEVKREPVKVTLVSGLGRAEIKLGFYDIIDRLLN